MANKKILVVFGATGNQGGSVIQNFVADPVMSQQFQLRGITRDPSKPASIALAKGVSMVKANLEDKESLRHALKDVFAVTNWAETMSPSVEEQQGRNIADICKELKIKHLIWSTQCYASKLTNGALTGIQHFDSKGRVDEYIQSLGIPATSLFVGAYFTFPFMLIAPSPASTPEKKAYVFASILPLTTRFPLISEKQDVGKYLKMILTQPEKTVGRQVQAAQGWYTPHEIVETFKACGLDMEFLQISDEQYRAYLSKTGVPEWFVEDMSQVMQFMEQYNLFGGKEQDQGVEIWKAMLGERMETFQEWAEKSPEVAALK